MKAVDAFSALQLRLRILLDVNRFAVFNGGRHGFQNRHAVERIFDADRKWLAAVGGPCESFDFASLSSDDGERDSVAHRVWVDESAHRTWRETGAS